MRAAASGELERLTTNRYRLEGEQDRLVQAHCADIYTRCDDTNRRLCNHAFFTKVFIDEDNELRVEHNRPFEMLLDPRVNANALTWAADAHKARPSTNVSFGKGSRLVRAVELRGFEPLTSSMPWKRATNCANAPSRLAAREERYHPSGRLSNRPQPPAARRSTCSAAAVSAFAALSASATSWESSALRPELCTPGCDRSMVRTVRWARGLVT